MTIIINIDVMLAKRKNECNGAFREGWNYDGESFYFEKCESKSGSFFQH